MSLVFSEEVRSRVFSAADKLQAELGRVPTIAEVRSLAKADMNATSALVGEWKRLQTARPAPVAVEVPESVRLAGDEALRAVWLAASEQAQSSLMAAESEWSKRQQEYESTRLELATEVDDLADQLALSNSLLNEAHASLRQAQLDLENEQMRAESYKTEASKQESRADQAEARTQEIESFNETLKQQLEHSQNETADVRSELRELRLTHHQQLQNTETLCAQQIESARSELSTTKAKFENTVEIQNSQIVTLQNRLTELQTELITATLKLTSQEEGFATQRKNAAQEVSRQANILINANAERDAALKVAQEARERAARLEGQVEALKSK